MRHAELARFSLLALLSCAGCAAAGPSTGSEAEAITGAAACTTDCPSEGDFALRLTGNGFKDLAGKRVSISALQAKLDKGVQVRTTVILEERVGAQGSFALSCPKALSENFSYPAYGVWLDASGDGKCGAGDLALSTTLYGWRSDVAVVVAPSANPAPDFPVESAWASPETIQVWDRSFCESFGFPR